MKINSNHMMGFRIWISLLALIPLLTLFSCLDNNDEGPVPDTAFVSIYHGSPNAPELDIYTESRRITNSPLAYSQSFPYSQFFTADRTLKFNPHNASNTLLETEHTFEKDKIYTLFIVNEVADLEVLQIEDSWEDPDGDHAMVRLAHLSPDAGELEVLINDESLPFGNSNPYLEVTEFLKMEKAKVKVTVKSKISGEKLVEVNEIDLRGNRVYTLMIRGFADPSKGNNQLSVQLITNYIKF